MGRGRAPCCDKSKVKKGPWSPAEDIRLITFIQKHGHGNWRSLPKQAGLLRCGKSCRLRWINYLRPDVKRGNFSKEEEETIIKLHLSLGNKWSKIASCLPGRTDNEIKNVWNTYLKKRLTKRDDMGETKSLSRCCSSLSSSASSFVSAQGNAQELEVGAKEQEVHEGFLAKTSNEMSNLKEKIEESRETSSSSSIYSYESNYSGSNRVVDASSMASDEVGSLFNFEGFVSSDQAMIEIPLESDVDFWDMLDNLDPKESDELKPKELDASQDGEEECRRWLKYLESELGLEAKSDDELAFHHHQSPPEEASTQEMEFDHDKSYFHMWPSPPQSFYF